MNDEIDHSVTGNDHFHLFIPQGRGIVLQDMKEAVVLGQGYRKLRHPTGKRIRYHRAAAATLSFKPGDIRKRHVVGKNHVLKPVGFSVKNRRAESFGSEANGVVVDLSGAFQEFRSISKEIPFVIESLDIDF